MFHTSLMLLLMAAFSCTHCQVQLNQQSAMATKPGQMLTLSCGVSGYSLTDTSYCTDWIRQPAGKPLEWIGCVCGSGNVYHSDKLKNKFSVSRDISSSTVNLNGQNLQTEDSAVYYCAREGYPDGAFGYWGKGTMVTVSHDNVKNASISVMEQCGTGTKLYACMTTGPFPVDSFEWSKGSQTLTDFVQYPAVYKTGDGYIRISTISTSLTSNEDMTCKVTYKNDSMSKNVRVDPKSPTLSLSQISTNKGKYVMCAIEDFYPEQITVNWKEGTTGHRSTEQTSTKHPSGYYYAKSFLMLDSVMKNVPYTCEVTHNGKTFTKTQSFTDNKLSVVLTPPSGKLIFLQNKAVLKCIITGSNSKAVNDAQVTWKVDGIARSSGVQLGKTEPDGNNQLQKVSNIQVDLAEWFSGKTVECQVHDTSDGNTFVEKRKVKQGDGSDPVVLIYTLPVNQNRKPDSLVCEVRGSSIGDVYIMWRVDGGDYKEGRTGVLKQDDGNMSLVSILTDTKNSQKFTCAVKHGNMKNYTSPMEVSHAKSKYRECPVCDT